MQGTGWYSNFGPLGQRQRVIDIDTEIADCIFDVGMAEQYLHGSKVSSRLVDERSLGAPQRMGTIFMVVEADCRHPLMEQSSVLARAQVAEIIYATGKDEIARRATAPGEPGRQAISCFGHDFELNRPAGLLLDHCGAISKRSATDQIANPHFDKVTATKLAVDREIEQGTIPDPLVLVEKKADRPDVAGPQRPFRADLLASIPWAPIMYGGGKI